jgi:dienelactone hydrolase
LVPPAAQSATRPPGPPWWHDRKKVAAAGAGVLLLVFLVVWVIVRDREGRETARVKVPPAGSATVQTAARDGITDTAANSPSTGEPSSPVPSFQNLASYLESRAVQLTAGIRPPAQVSDWEQQRAVLQKHYFAILGLDPLPDKTPLNPRVVGEPLDVGRSIFRRVVFESRPKNYVAAHLYLPKELHVPAPAIIHVPGHDRRDGYHHHVLSYAAHGYVALNLPALGEEGKLGGGMGCGHKGPYYGEYHWYNTGYNPAGAEVWDTIRAVDYLLSLPDERTGKPLVDPARIGIAGFSGGAARTLWVMAAEPRLSAGVAAQGFTTVAGCRGALPNSCDVGLFYNYYGLEYGPLFGLSAPRRLLVQHGTQDALYPNSGEVAEYLKSLYAVHGQPDGFEYQVFQQGHSDTPTLRQAEYAWFDRWLGKDCPSVTAIVDEPVPESLKDAANVRCFATPPPDAAHIEQQFTQPTPTHEVKSEADFRRFKQELTAHFREEVLRTAYLPFTSELHEEDGGWVLVVDQELRHRAVFVFQPGQRRKTVVLLSRAAAADANKFAAEFRAAGVNLLVVEPAGADPAMFPKGERPHWLRLAALVGETLTSLRVRDALGAVRALAGHAAVDPQGIYLCGCGELAIPALYAALVDERVAGVFLTDAPDHHTSETALFRVLRYADVPQSAALLCPRPLYFSGTCAAGFAWTQDVYRLLGQPGRCLVTTESPATSVAKQPAHDVRRRD